jgi:hypothetical protein
MFDGGGDVPSSGMPAGPLGCNGAVLVLAITAICVGLFIAMIWWMLRDVGAT